jgi:hypothetical protein
MAATSESPPRNRQFHLLLLALFGLVAASSNQLNYQTDHQMIVEGAGDILSYFAMSEAAPGLVKTPVPYHHAQRIFLPYVLGLVSFVTGLPVQRIYLAVGILFLFVAFRLFIRCCELLKLGEETLFLASLVVLFNPYVFRHYFMFNGYINDIGFLMGLSISLFGHLAHRRGILLAGIILSSLSRQTTLLTVPAWIVLEYLAERPRRWKFDFMTLSYVALPVSIYLGSSYVASRSGLPSETEMALMGLFYWLEADFSLGRMAEFALRGLIPFVFLVALFLGFKTHRGFKTVMSVDGDMLATQLGLLVLAVLICVQPVLGGPDWTTNSIARLNALAVPPIALAVGLYIDGYVNRLSFQVASAIGAFLALGSIHHIYTFNGVFSAEKNKWFAALHIATAITMALVLRCSKPTEPVLAKP